MTMCEDLFLYLSGPITAKNGFTVEENVFGALRVYLDCLKRGYPSFCPHLSGLFPSAHAEIPYETWIAYDFAIIRRSTHVVTLPRWESSAGACREVVFARSLGIPVIDWSLIHSL